jgi:hypothetical protein
MVLINFFLCRERQRKTEEMMRAKREKEKEEEAEREKIRQVISLLLSFLCS